jgi:hypothetical protein
MHETVGYDPSCMMISTQFVWTHISLLHHRWNYGRRSSNVHLCHQTFEKLCFHLGIGFQMVVRRANCLNSGWSAPLKTLPQAVMRTQYSRNSA